MKPVIVTGANALAVAIAGGYEVIHCAGQAVDLDTAERVVEHRPGALRLQLDPDRRAVPGLGDRVRDYAHLLLDHCPAGEIDPVTEPDTTHLLAAAAALHDRLLDGEARRRAAKWGAESVSGPRGRYKGDAA